MYINKAWIFLLLFSLPTTVLAASDTTGFVGLNYVVSSVSPNHAADHANMNALQLNVGTWLNEQSTLAVEGRVGLGVSSGHANYRNHKGRRDVSIKRYYGGYFRAEFPDTMTIRPYGLVGLSRLETREKDSTSSNHSESYNGLSLGFGVNYSLTEPVYVNLEYLRLADHGSDQVNHLGLGINARF